MNEFNVTFLGTAAASFNPRSPTACCLVEAGGIRIMIDAGIGALRQLRRIGIDPHDIDVLLITHWHIDHFLGLPAVLRFTRRSSPLCVYGPAPSFPARLYLAGLLRAAHVDYEVVTGSFSKDHAGVRIEAVPTVHGIRSLGWVIREMNPADGSLRLLVFTGDTRPVPEILKAAKGADLLIHEATFLDVHAHRAHSHDHSTPAQAANLALEAGAGALALTHIPPRNVSSGALKEAREIFPGMLVPSLMDKITIEPFPDAKKTGKSGWGRVKVARTAA